MFAILFAKKSHRTGYFGWFPSIYVFNLNSTCPLEDSFFFYKGKFIKAKVVPSYNNNYNNNNNNNNNYNNKF